MSQFNPKVSGSKGGLLVKAAPGVTLRNASVDLSSIVNMNALRDRCRKALTAAPGYAAFAGTTDEKKKKPMPEPHTVSAFRAGIGAESLTQDERAAQLAVSAFGADVKKGNAMALENAAEAAVKSGTNSVDDKPQAQAGPVSVKETIAGIGDADTQRALRRVLPAAALRQAPVRRSRQEEEENARAARDARWEADDDELLGSRGAVAAPVPAPAAASDAPASSPAPAVSEGAAKRRAMEAARAAALTKRPKRK
jgi:hypothetical protein